LSAANPALVDAAADDRLERELAELRRQVGELREALGEPGEPQA
jgi:hypothetical protein